MVFIEEIANRYKTSETTNQRIREFLELEHVGNYTDQRPYGIHTWLFDQVEEDVRVCRLVLEPYTSTTTHIHTIKSHYFYVQSGTLTVKIDDQPPFEVPTGEYCYIDKACAHLISNETEVPAILLEVMQPAMYEDKIILHHPFMEKRAKQQLQNEWSWCTEEMLATFSAYCRLTSEQLIESAEFTLEKPYGLNHIICSSGDFGISYMQMQPGQSTSLHSHANRSEFFYVYKGTLTLIQEDQTNVLKRFECGFSRPFRAHSLANRGDEILEVLEIFSPPLLNDKVRIQDKYDRKLGTVQYTE